MKLGSFSDLALVTFFSDEQLRHHGAAHGRSPFDRNESSRGIARRPHDGCRSVELNSGLRHVPVGSSAKNIPRPSGQQCHSMAPTDACRSGIAVMSLFGPSATSLDVRCLVGIGGKADEGKAGQNRRS